MLENVRIDGLRVRIAIHREARLSGRPDMLFGRCAPSNDTEGGAGRRPTPPSIGWLGRPVD